MLPTAMKAKRISEITDTHMATQQLLIPSEKSLHAGELNIEQNASNEQFQPAQETRFKPGFQIHDPMMQSEDHLSIKRLLSGEVSITNLKMHTIDPEVNQEQRLSQSKQEQVFLEKGVQQEQVFSDKGIQMQSDLISQDNKQILSHKDQSVQLSNKVKPVLVDRSCQGSVSQEQPVRKSTEIPSEQY